MSTGLAIGLTIIPALIAASKKHDIPLMASLICLAPLITGSVMLGLFGFTYIGAVGAHSVLAIIIEPTFVNTLCIATLCGAVMVSSIYTTNAVMDIVDGMKTPLPLSTNGDVSDVSDTSDSESDTSSVSIDEADDVDSTEVVHEDVSESAEEDTKTPAETTNTNTTETTETTTTTTTDEEVAAESPAPNWKATADFEALRNAPPLSDE